MCARMQGAQTVAPTNAARAFLEGGIGSLVEWEGLGGTRVCAPARGEIRHSIPTRSFCTGKTRRLVMDGFGVPRPCHVRDRAGLPRVSYAAALIDFRIPSTRFKIVANRVFPVLLLLMAFSRFVKAMGLCVFSRISFRKGCTLAKTNIISLPTPGEKNNSSFSTPCRMKDATMSQ